ncbi:hypothetical protein ABK040_008912 [Willaertia magna]
MNNSQQSREATNNREQAFPHQQQMTNNSSNITPHAQPSNLPSLQSFFEQQQNSGLNKQSATGPISGNNENNNNQLLITEEEINLEPYSIPSLLSKEEKDELLDQIERYIQERRPHEALSLLANQTKSLQDILDELINQSKQQVEVTNNNRSINYLMETIEQVKFQLVELLLKKLEMMIPMQLNQEAERDLRIILQIDPNNEQANQFISILKQNLEKQQSELSNSNNKKLTGGNLHTQHETGTAVINERKRTNTLYDFKEEIEELECPLCYRVFYEPITLSCGHTFDRSCICRVHDYSDKCPLCRQVIHVVPYDYPVTVVINELVQKFCKVDYEERKKEMDIETKKELNINQLPIFVLDFVLFPNTNLPLHIFEPRYRLMMRRCMSGSKSFGLVCCGPNRNGDIAKYGCIAKITNFKLLPDGRSIIETVGTDRFKILEKWETDGYICAKVQIIKDKTLTELESLQKEQISTYSSTTTTSSSTTAGVAGAVGGVNSQQQQNNIWYQAEKMTMQQLNERLYLFVSNFLEEVGDETKQSILQKIGPLPNENDCEKLSFWVSALLPLTTQLKLDLLSITNTKERLRVLLSICNQIAQTQQSNCAIQ